MDTDLRDIMHMNVDVEGACDLKHSNDITWKSTSILKETFIWHMISV